MQKPITLACILLVMVTAASAQTLLQRCLGVVPGREPSHPLGPSPATMSYCRQLPGWSLYDQAGQKFTAGDRAGAARLALEAAEAGNAIAQQRLATMYAKGEGVPANPHTAFHWMSAAAAQNEPLAEAALGYIYEYGSAGGYAGYGVADNWDTAAKLWLASASQGWSIGEFSMGRAYQYGIGVALNQQSAISWYDKAAAQGHGQAQYFAKYLRDNHGADGSSRDDDERALLGPLMGRMFSIWPPYGACFHHLSERLAYVRWEAADEAHRKAVMNYTMQARRYQECKDAGGDNCMRPVAPWPR